MKSQFVKTWWRRASAIVLGSVIALVTSSFQARAQFTPAQKWSDWMCIGQELCLTGDFNGDGRDDAIAFVRNTKPGVPQGDVWIALSNGAGFGPRQKWHDWICSNGEVCAVGDFNRDGRDDVFAFGGSTQPEPGRGDVWVYLSTGIRFAAAQKWSDLFCVGQQICSVGDFNRDGRDDVIAFVRNTQPEPARGNVKVALSTGTAFGPAQKWSDWFCIGQEICAVGDFNGDRFADIIAFVRDTAPGISRGETGYASGKRSAAWAISMELVEMTPSLSCGTRS
jgi:FG-GAP-like repeat